MEVKAFHDENTGTMTYVVHDPETKDAVVIDAVWDFDPLAWKTYTETADKVAAFIEEAGLTVQLIMDTHAHADHLSAMDVMKQKLGAKTMIGEHITVVQEVFSELFNIKDFPADGSQFDILAKEGGPVRAGSITLEPIHTPGHTPACYTWKIEDMIFTGDTLFMPDFGMGRCDFPKGSAEDLYNSVHEKLYKLPPETRVFVGHDYQPGGRELRYETTISESMKENKQLREETARDEFVKVRTERDKTLSQPKLILHSLQVNIRAGKLPGPEDNGTSYMKMPIGLL